MSSFSTQFNNTLSSIRKICKERLLEPVHEKTEVFLKEYVQRNMYRAYTPIQYERTYNFLSSIDSGIIDTEDEMDSMVFFNSQFLNHTRNGVRVYVPYLIETNEPKRNPSRWVAGAKRDTSFYSQTSTFMNQTYQRERKALKGNKIIY